MIMRGQFAAAFLAATVLFTSPMKGQDLAGPATLVADGISFDDDKLIAEGGVEVFADGRILRAQRITYLRDEDRIEVEGPLVLIDGDDQVVVADFASLGSNLRSSVLRGARLVLDQQLQIAATQITTGAEGRFTELFQTVASSCEVCAAYPVPLWQIRARRVIHDREKRQIYFENARFEVVGLPVAWFPVLRIPDPSVERASGILAPTFISDDNLGSGIQVPFFFTLGPSRDLTLTPFVSTNEARSLGFRYRQAFNSGDIQVEGLVTRDNIRPGETRGYVFANGDFTLPRDYTLDFQIELANDDDVLADYLITGGGLLETSVTVGRIDRNDLIRAEIVSFDDQRSGESTRFQPSPVVSLERQTRVERDVLGGQLVYTLQAQGRRRAASEADLTGDNSSELARDLLRTSAAVEWRRTRTTGAGLVWTTLGGLDLDAFDIGDDPDFDNDLFVRARPYAGLEVRFPLARAEAGGVRHVIEPVAQVIFAPDNVSDTRTRTVRHRNSTKPICFPPRASRAATNWSLGTGSISGSDTHAIPQPAGASAPPWAGCSEPKTSINLPRVAGSPERPPTGCWHSTPNIWTVFASCNDPFCPTACGYRAPRRSSNGPDAITPSIRALPSSKPTKMRAARSTRRNGPSTPLAI